MSQKPIEFQPEPRPERIASLSVGPGGESGGSKLAVGVVLRTEDVRGLKIVPTHEIGIRIDDAFFSVPVSMMRDLLPRIAAMCDAADALNKTGVSDEARAS